MKKYEIPQIEIIAVNSEDVITTSGDTYVEWNWQDVFDEVFNIFG